MAAADENVTGAVSNIVPLKNDDLEAAKKRLPRFIMDNIEPIVDEWEAFARTLTPSASGMTPMALRDHIHQILDFIMADMASSQTAAQQHGKAHGKTDSDRSDSAAQTHAAVRFVGGFDIGQMVSEYRALRASVIKLWSRISPAFDSRDIGDMTRFNKSIDQELTESVNFYTTKVAQSKDLLVGILGHDLRGPLQAITLSTELTLYLGKLNERQTMLTKNTLDSANRMARLVDDLLDVTRARFGAGLPVVRSTMDMGFVAHQIVDEIRVVHPTRIITLKNSGELKGDWDKVRVGQVFSNLLANAIQYGFQDSPISVDVEGMPDSVTVKIGNAGVPIPPEKVGLIFDPLTRVGQDHETNPPTRNLGFGLYITKEVVVAHGGTIEVSSSALDGTAFTARFPRAATMQIS